MASQPTPPNPYQTAGAQNQQNALASQSSTISGNANATNPYGSVSYDQGTMTADLRRQRQCLRLRAALHPDHHA